MKIYLFPVIAFALFAFAGQPKNDNYSINKNTVAISEQVRFAKQEVSQGEYKRFLEYLIAQGRTEDAARFRPDTAIWQFNGKLSAYNDYYWQHPAFENYPVVGITHAAAEAYCEWMTQTYASQLNTQEGNANVRYRFRLPTQAEWMQAAGEGEFPGIFAGGHYYPRDHKGRFLFNHKLGKANYSGIGGIRKKEYEGYMITAPVDAFFPDNKGLRNMTGNVAEMLEEDGIAKGGSWKHLPDECRMENIQRYEKPESWLGFRMVVERMDGQEDSAR